MQANLLPHYAGGESFFTMFALFFPAVTGIMAGANMSGDLRDPAKSIPRGTLVALAMTGIIYFSQALLLAGSRRPEQLVTDNMVVADVARWPALITVGLFAATLSSALASMVGAPRILQAFARDNVFQWLRVFAPGSGRAGEPRRAVVFTFLISQTAILAADLNAIAPVITIAFLITYGLLNLATFYEVVTKNPSYRPRFRWCHWSTSLTGAVGCLAAMLLINWIWATVSIALMAVLHWAITRQEVEARWGDVHRGLLFERTRRTLLRLEDELHHPKNWRPIILALSGASWDRPHLAVYGHWFTSGHGILSLGQVIQGDLEDRVERRASQERILHNFIREQQLEAFPALVVAPYVSDGVESLVQCQGLGALRPNTVLLGWPTDPQRVETFGAMLRSIAAVGVSLVAVRLADEPEDPWRVPNGTLDIWWRGRQNGELMLLLAHLLTTNDAWRSHQIRLLRVIPSPAGKAEVLRHLSELIASSRIRATPYAVVGDDPREEIQAWSRSAAVAFLGFEAPEEGDERSFCQRMDQWAEKLPCVVFVDSIGGMSLES
jgi:hypothetical protein